MKLNRVNTAVVVGASRSVAVVTGATECGLMSIRRTPLSETVTSFLTLDWGNACYLYLSLSHTPQGSEISNDASSRSPPYF